MAFAGDRLFQSGVQGQYGTEGATFVSLDGKTDPPPEQVAPTLGGVGLLTPQPLEGAAKLESMATPLVLGEKICIATLEGRVIVTDLNGQQLWDYDLGSPSHTPPVAAGGLLIVGCDDGNVYAFREGQAAK